MPELRSFSRLSNDLYFEAECTCPHERLEGLNHSVRLIGYYDDYFFDTVNAKPRERACKCGRRFRYQWFRDGVAFTWLNGKEAGDEC